jgi:hypothetical protein
MLASVCQIVDADIRVDDRNAYLAALDRASIDMNIAPFAQFISEHVRASMKTESTKTTAKT